MPLHITYPLIMEFNVQGYAVFIHKIIFNNKISLPWEGENPFNTLPAWSLRSLAMAPC